MGNQINYAVFFDMSSGKVSAYSSDNKNEVKKKTNFAKNNPLIDEIVEQISEDSLRSYVEALTKIHTRYTLAKENKEEDN